MPVSDPAMGNPPSGGTTSSFRWFWIMQLDLRTVDLVQPRKDVTCPRSHSRSVAEFSFYCSLCVSDLGCVSKFN